MRGAGWLAGQPAAFQDRVLNMAQLRRHAPSETIFALGDPPGALWGLVRGALSVLIAPDAAPPMLVHVASPGWWAGEAALMTGTPRRVSLTAREESWTLRLDAGDIARMAADDPETWRRLATITVGHLDHALAVIATLARRDADARVAVALCLLVDPHGDPYAHHEPVSIRVSQEELAEMVGLSRNSVAPVLKRLAAAGLIALRYRQVEILNVVRLADYGAARDTAHFRATPR